MFPDRSTIIVPPMDGRESFKRFSSNATLYRNVVIVTLIGVLGTLVVSYSINQRSRAEASSAFRMRAARLDVSMTERFGRYETLLRSAQGFWAANDTVSPQQWDTFVS